MPEPIEPEGVTPDGAATQAGAEGEAEAQPQAPEMPPELVGLVDQAVTRALEASGEKYATRMTEMERENIRLRAQLEAGGAQQAKQEFLETRAEYEYAAQSMNSQMQLAQVQGEEERAAMFRNQLQGLQQNYREFEQHERTKEQTATERRIQRAQFLASKQVDPNSGVGRYVERLHDSGVELDEIENELIKPFSEIQRLRGQEQATATTGAALAAANSIEPGKERDGPPPPISRDPRDPATQEEDGFVDHYKAHTRGGASEQALFGDYG